MVAAPVVALFNSNPESIELVESALSAAGFTVVFASIPEMRAGRFGVDDFVRRYDPAVIVYDVAPPYGENWQLLQDVHALPAMRDRAFVVTTVNARRVALLASRDDRIYEVAGQPYDLGQIVYAVREAASARPAREAGDATAPQTPLQRSVDERRHRIERRHASWTTDQLLSRAADIERRRASRREAEVKGGGKDPRKSAA